MTDPRRNQEHRFAEIVSKMPPPPRTPGRPRSERATRAVLRAAGELLDRHGFAGLTIDAVARRARVSKATIYRWWPNRSAVAMDAFLASLAPRLAWPDSGSIRQDTRWQMCAVAEVLGSPTVGTQIRSLIGRAQDDPELAATFRDRFLLPRRAENRLAFERAIDRGQLRRDLDVELAIDALYGPLYYRLLVGHQPLDTAFAQRLFDDVFPAFETAAASVPTADVGDPPAAGPEADRSTANRHRRPIPGNGTDTR